MVKSKLKNQEPNSSTSLFRSKAIEAYGSYTAGVPLARTPVTWLVLSAFLVSFLLTAIVFLANGSYVRKERVLGHISSGDGTSNVISDTGGVVAKVLVGSGEVVTAGTPVLRLRSMSTLWANREGHTDTLDSIDNQILELKQQMKLRDEQRKILAPLTQRQTDGNAYVDEQSVAPGNTSSSEVPRQESLTPVTRSRAYFESRLRESELRRQIYALEERKARLAFSQSWDVTSPISGTVENLLRAQGQLAAPGDLLFSVHSSERRFHVIAYVPSKSIGFIDIGDPVRIKFDSFPHRHFGSMQAKISRIPEIPVATPPRARGAQPDDISYLIEIELSEQSVTANGDPRPLREGMNVTAELILEERSFLQWLFRPQGP